MIEVTNTTAQTIQPGQTVTFDNVLLHAGCAECFNKQLPNSIRLRYNGCRCAPIYELHFNGNITSSTAGDVLQLAIAVGGSPLLETGMNALPAAVGDLVNVSTSTLFRPACGDIDRVSILNTGTTPVTVAPNSNFYVVRKS